MRQIVSASPVAQVVYETIREAICDGVIPPDTRVVEDEVARRLGVSRQPVHQALRQLRQESFLIESGRRGLVVAPIDTEFARQLYELRAALDSAAAIAAARQASCRDRTRGEQIIRAGRAAVADGDLAAMATADFAFHDFIYQLSGNKLIEATARMNWHHVRRSIMLLADRPTTLGPFWDEHDQILHAIIERDPSAAGELARSHAIASGRVLVRLQPTGGDEPPEPAPH
jgi:DNA-binding GntR family transcriptional regulator